MPLVRAVLVGVVLVLGAVVLGPLQPLLALARVPSGWSVMACCRAMLMALGVRVEVVGALGSPSAPRLIVANHVSWIDILALASVEPVSFLAKREVGTWPIIGALATHHGTVYIDRRRRRSILGANAAMAAALAAGSSVLLFPEGTTYDGRRRGRFLTSHLACLGRGQGGTAAQPVGLAYSDPVAAWIGDDTLLPHLWAVLRRPAMVCRLHYGTRVAIATGFDRKALGRTLAAGVEDLLAEAPLETVPLRPDRGAAGELAS